MHGKVGLIGSALVLGSLFAACDGSQPPRPQTNTLSVIPSGDPREVALACGRASVLLYLMTLEDWPPDYRYLDPQGIPGYDPKNRKHDALAAQYLGEAVAKLGVWNEKIENDPFVLNQALRENGWTIVEAGKKIAANKHSWRNLEERVNWCLDHYDVSLPIRTSTGEW